MAEGPPLVCGVRRSIPSLPPTCPRKSLECLRVRSRRALRGTIGVTRPRIIVPGATMALTRRNTHRKLLWTPFATVVHQGWMYALARAQQEHDVLLHHGILQSNHAHLTVTPKKANLPEFLRYLHRESARFLQEALLAHGYDAPSCVWDERPTHVMRCLDAGAALAWILYSHLNPVAAGLVERVEDYPGFVSDLGLLKGGVIVVERPPMYFSKDQPSEVALRFAPVPMLARAFGGDSDGLVHWMRKEARRMEDEHRRRRKAADQPVLGAAVVRSIHPFAEPQTPREHRGETVPEFMLRGGYGLHDVRCLSDVRAHCVGERVRFGGEYRGSLRQWREGDRDVEFPAGTYQMRVLHGVNVAEPHPDAILCAPGDPSVRPSGNEKRLDLGALLEELRESVLAEHGEDADSAKLRRVLEPASRPLGSDRSRQPAGASGLESPARSSERPHPRRLVTLRTRRGRGKQRKPT